MSSPISRFIVAGSFFLFIFLTGYVLSRTGRPYGTGLLTIHKLIGLSAGVFLLLTIVKVYRMDMLDRFGLAATAAVVLLFFGLIITGGLMSASSSPPRLVAMIHKTFPYLTVLSSGVALYVLA